MGYTMSDSSHRKHQIMRFVAALERLDQAGRARLRRNAGRSLDEARDGLAVFYQILPYDLTPHHHESYFLIATLYPLAPSLVEARSFGRTLRRIRDVRGAIGATSLDRRVRALIDCDTMQLPYRVRQCVRLASASALGVDWIDLLSSILDWDRPDRSVQLRWTRHYFLHQMTDMTTNEDNRTGEN
jgi:CRISPR system Cascade subunit CasB